MSSFPINNFQESDGLRPEVSSENFLRVDKSPISPRRSALSLEREQRIRQERISRFFRNLIILLLGILVMEIVFQFFIAPQIVITSVKINVSKEFSISNRKIMEAAGLTGILYYYTLNPAKAALRLEKLPQVARAEVIKSFPRSLTINIIPRKALALSLVPSGGGEVPLVVDSQGVVFAIGGGPDLGDLPIISGVRFPEVRMGMKLPERMRSFLEKLDRLRRENPALFGMISELKFVKRNSVNYDVLLYLRGYSTKVHIENEINEKLMKYILMVLDVIYQEGINSPSSKIDFRSSRIVYQIGGD